MQRTQKCQRCNKIMEYMWMTGPREALHRCSGCCRVITDVITGKILKEEGVSYG